MKTVTGSSIDINKSKDYCQVLFKSNSFSNFTLIPTVELEEDPITKKLLPNEVTNILNHFKSKAKSNMGISTFDLKKLKTELTPFLCQIFNDILSGCSSVPKKWLEGTMFFIYKDDGDKVNPEKHRTICAQNPLLKAFMSTIKTRIDDHAEKNGLYPTYQFGFRRNRSTVSAAILLHQAVANRLNKKQRTYPCFVDFRKCFDSIDRNLLFIKLQYLGIPPLLCKTIDCIYRELRFYIKSDNLLSEPFKTSIGLPQGCCLSPTLFSLFVHHIGNCFSHDGLELNGKKIPYLQYADDLVILCKTPKELQEQMNSLMEYCKNINLTLNETKTKVMVFHKGRLPESSFYIFRVEIEIVKELNYLCFIFTCQLSFSKHIQALNTKAKARIGLMFSRLPLAQLSLKRLAQLFEIYVLPIYLYGAALWMSRVARNNLDEMDAVWTRYLKRYLSIPLQSNNAITYRSETVTIT